MARKKSKKKPKKSSSSVEPENKFFRYRRIAVRFLLAGAATVCVAYLGLVIFGCCVSDKLIFPVPPAGYTADSPNLVKLPLQGGGEVPALWLENKKATRTVLYFHGNGTDIGRSRWFPEFLHAQGYSVLAVEYPGYGITAGNANPSEAGCDRAAEAGYDFLQTTRGVSEKRIVIYGMSLGTGVAVNLAAKKPSAGALVLESPFLSTFRVKTGIKLVPFDTFDSYAKIDKVKCPVLIAHGTKDAMIPFWHGKKLYAAATGAPRKQFYSFENAGHGGHNKETYQKFFAEMNKFLESSE